MLLFYQGLGRGGAVSSESWGLLRDVSRLAFEMNPNLKQVEIRGNAGKNLGFNGAAEQLSVMTMQYFLVAQRYDDDDVFSQYTVTAEYRTL